MGLLKRRDLLAAATLAAGIGTGQGARPARAAGPIGSLQEGTPKPLPMDLAFVDAQGHSRAPAEFRGQGLVINLWATWCPPCVEEMPALDRAQAALAAEGILILAASSDRGGKAQVETFYQQRGIRQLGLWLDPRGAAGRSLGVRGLPTTLIVDRSGMERARLEGSAEWDSSDMLARLRRLVRPGEIGREQQERA